MYFGTNRGSVSQATATVDPNNVYQGRQDPNEYAVEATLEPGKTYYWRIDEVNEAQTPAIWPGDVWSFSTREYLVIDDFESYNDEENQGISRGAGGG